jgi:hypothetical protein
MLLPSTYPLSPLCTSPVANLGMWDLLTCCRIVKFSDHYWEQMRKNLVLLFMLVFLKTLYTLWFLLYVHVWLYILHFMSDYYFISTTLRTLKLRLSDLSKAIGRQSWDPYRAYLTPWSLYKLFVLWSISICKHYSEKYILMNCSVFPKYTLTFMTVWVVIDHGMENIATSLGKCPLWAGEAK